MELAIQLSPEATRSYLNIQDYPRAMYAALSKGLDLGVQLMIDRTLPERFSGQGPFPVAEHRLGVISGRLRASIFRTPVKVDATGVEISVGSNVKYWAPHEYGMDKTVTVRAHSRIRVVSSKGERASLGTITKRQVQAGATGYEGPVKQHTRRMRIPERAPLRTGMKENKGLLEDALNTALVAAWTKQASVNRRGGIR